MTQPGVPASRNRLSGVTPVLAMAAWWLKGTWRLLLVTGLGMVIAVLLVTLLPLSSAIALDAGLRQALAAAPASGDITVTVLPNLAATASVTALGQQIDQIVHQDLGADLAPNADFAIATGSFPVTTPSGSATLDLTGLPPDHLDAHLTLQAGRWPLAAADALEIALPTSSAQDLHATPGTDFAAGGLTTGASHVRLRVVGLFTVNDLNDPFWHSGAAFQPEALGNDVSYPALAASTPLIANLVTDQTLNVAPQLDWYYHLALAQLNPAAIDSDAAGTLVDHIQTAQSHIHASISGRVAVQSAELTTPASQVATTYAQEIAAAQVPVNVMLAAVLALVVMFVIVMAELLVERQSDTIALLRSRGASRSQIFGAMMLQGTGLSIVALLVGPLLAVALARYLTPLLIPGVAPASLDVLAREPLQVAFALRWYALAGSLGALVALGIALYRATQDNVVGHWREMARSTQRPLWQRLHLDLFALLAAVGSALFANIVITNGNITPGTRALLAPVELIGPVLAVLAISLIALRLLPGILQRGVSVADRGTGATALLALAQLARAPWRALRVSLLLVLATVLVVFALIFFTSETQRIADTTTFQVGADFSGTLPQLTSAAQPSLPDLTARYAALPGAITASLGFVAQTSPLAVAQNRTIELRAVDADTFGTTASWPERFTGKPLTAIMVDLAAQRAAATSADQVPAYVDANGLQALHVQLATPFTLQVPGYAGGGMHFIVAGVVNAIPSVYDSASDSAAGGLLVDYQTYAQVYQHDLNGVPFAPNTVWLRSMGDSASLQALRTQLRHGDLQVGALADRRAMATAAQVDPVQSNLLSIIGLGTIAALFLGLTATLVGSWLSMCGRASSFAALRAVGATPGQVRAILFWEQAITSGLAVLLGTLLGWLLALVVVPVLVFTQTPTATGQTDFWLHQAIPTVQVMVPLGWVGLALGFIGIVCGMAAVVATSIVTRFAIATTLRQSE